MEMTDKDEDAVRTALHDAENDANIAVLMLLDDSNKQVLFKTLICAYLLKSLFCF